MAKDKNTEEYLNEPVDTYNHCIDSLRYSVERFYKPEMKKRTGVKQTINAIKSMGL